MGTGERTYQVWTVQSGKRARLPRPELGPALSRHSVRELTLGYNCKNRQDLQRIKESVLRAGQAPGVEVWAQELERGDSGQPRAGGSEGGR